MKLYTTIIFVCLHLSLFSQDILFKKNIKLKRGWGTDKRDAFPVVNDSTQHTSLFLIDKTSIKGCLFDSNLNMIDSLEAERPEGYPEVMGSTVDKGRYSVFFTSGSYEKVAIITFDYTTKKTLQSFVKLPFDKERYAGSASHQGKFFLFTVKKSSSVIHAYRFNNHERYSLHKFDFKTAHFANPPLKTLADVITDEEPILTIDASIANPIEVAAKKNKLFAFGDKLFLTFDHMVSGTAVISIDINSMASALTYYNYGRVDCVVGAPVNANSFLSQNHIFQLKVCQLGLSFTITDIHDKRVINELKVGREDDITFKNTPVVQEGGSSIVSLDERELDRTRQFLRKVSSSNAGISIYRDDKHVVATLGSHKVYEGKAVPGYLAPFANFGVPVWGIAIPYFNPTYYAFRSQKGTKAVHFKTILDSTTFVHQQGIVRETALDKIKEFTKDMDNDIVAETVFRKGDACILGYYHKKDDQYFLRAFRD